MLPIGHACTSLESERKQACCSLPADFTPCSPNPTPETISGKSPYSRYFDGTPQNSTAMVCFGASPLSRWLDGSPTVENSEAWSALQPVSFRVGNGERALLPTTAMVPMPCQWGPLWGPVPQDANGLQPFCGNFMGADTFIQHTWGPQTPGLDATGAKNIGCWSSTAASEDANSVALADIDSQRAASVQSNGELKSRRVVGTQGKVTKMDTAQGPKAVFVDLSKLRPVGATSQPSVVPPRMPSQTIPVRSKAGIETAPWGKDR